MRLSALLALTLTLSACGGSSGSTTSSSTTTAAGAAPSGGASPTTGNTVQVTMKNIAFNPSTVHAKVGQTVEWVNQDPVAHNVTYKSGPKFTSSPTMSQGAKFQLKLTQPGTISYICTFHADMVATIVVSK